MASNVQTKPDNKISNSTFFEKFKQYEFSGVLGRTNSKVEECFEVPAGHSGVNTFAIHICVMKHYEQKIAFKAYDGKKEIKPQTPICQDDITHEFPLIANGGSPIEMPTIIVEVKDNMLKACLKVVPTKGRSTVTPTWYAVNIIQLF